MTQQPTSSSDRRLNPFAFPTETDTHFRLLILVVFGGAINLFALLAILFGPGTMTNPLVIVACVLLSVPIFAWAWWRARGAAKRSIRKRGWIALASAGNGYEKEYIGYMRAQIQQTMNSLPETQQDDATLVWDDHNAAATGRAFGYGKEQYILIRRGLFDVFFSQFGRFQAVLLHEIGHIANQDVSKTTYSIALGRTFFAVATVASLVIGLIYILDFALLKLRSGATVLETLGSVGLFAEILLKVGLILILVEMVRALVLRVREYEADARAGFWSANARQWISHMLRAGATNGPGNKGRNKNLWQRFRRRVAPLHPSTESRIAGLRDERYLFRPSRLTAILSAFFTGFSLGTGYLLLFLIAPLLQLGSAIAKIVAETDSQLLQLFGLFTRIGLFLMFLTLLAAVVAIFGLLPIVGTVGVQIQKAAFADRLRKKGKRLLPISGLLVLSLLLSAGILTGFILTPVTAGLSVGSVSFRAIGFIMLPVYFAGWTFVFLAWALPLRWLSAAIYGSHKGMQRPDRKRRVLTIFSSMAFLPMFLAMIISQIILSAIVRSDPAIFGVVVRMAGSEISGLVVTGFLILTVWLVALVVSAVIWFIGWLLAYVSGWLSGRSGAGPAADQSWALMPDPVTLPKPRPLSVRAPVIAPPL